MASQAGAGKVAVSRIRRALNVVPTRPVLVLAPLVVVLALTYWFGSDYGRCTGHAKFRERFTEAVRAAAAGGRRLVLADLTAFSWDRALIQPGFKPGGLGPDCAFGWDWSRGEREALAAAGRLTVIAFVRGGRVVEYVELRGDRIRFRDLANPYTPATAIFRVHAATDEAGGFVLDPLR